VAAAVEREGATAVVVDHFRELVDPRFERATRAFYYFLLRRAPSVWALAYELGDRMVHDSAFTFGVTRLGTARLLRLVERLAPDAIVTTHATPAVGLATLVSDGHALPLHTTVVTDFIAHRQWQAPGIDRYCVPAPEVKHELIARGIPTDRIVVTGVPLRPEFDDPIDVGDARRHFGLPTGKPIVLAMAGSEAALGRLPDVARALMRPDHPVEALLLAGRDRDLAGRLRSMTAGTGLRVLGYVPEVRALMAAADLLVTKAGGMTVAEAIAAGLPMILYGSLPGQERRNERYVARGGFGLTARSPRVLARALDRAFGDPALLEHLRERIRRAGEPRASRRIARVVLGRDTGDDR
jgi:processive 1,2-diacylglycerol beta-glucosyltransferase